MPRSDIRKLCRLVEYVTLKIQITRTHLIVRLHQDLVVFAQGNKEHDGRHVLKAVDPLPALGTLSPHIHHPETERKQTSGKGRAGH